jgi:orotidine-5'-phosphate decarboxylase
MKTPINASDRLIVALDVPEIADARTLVRELHGVVSFFKVGLSLQLAPGVRSFIDELIQQDKKVFLDYKYLDVEETVRKAVERAASSGVTFLTIHGSGNTVKAGVQGRGNSPLKLLAVTVLTSFDAKDIQELGFQCSVEDLVLHRAKKAIDAGCDGVIASGREAGKIRKLAGAHALLIVTPGIRPADNAVDEQKRAVQPADAVRSGADYLVVGRPVYADPNPRSSAERIVKEMQAAFELSSQPVPIA